MNNSTTILEDDATLTWLEKRSVDKSLDYAEVDEILRRVPALCATVRALRAENERLKEAHKQIQHRCMCCVTNKECSQAVLDIDSISRKALGNQIHGYKVGEIK